MTKTIFQQAAAGIGRVVMICAGKRGWNVAITYVANGGGPTRACKAVEAAGGKALAIRATPRSRSMSIRFQRDGKGVRQDRRFRQQRRFRHAYEQARRQEASEDIAALVETNVLGALLGAREAARRMSKSRAAAAVRSSTCRRPPCGSACRTKASTMPPPKGAMDPLTLGLSRELRTGRRARQRRAAGTDRHGIPRSDGRWAASSA